MRVTSPNLSIPNGLRHDEQASGVGKRWPRLRINQRVRFTACYRYYEIYADKIISPSEGRKDRIEILTNSWHINVEKLDAETAYTLKTDWGKASNACYCNAHDGIASCDEHFWKCLMAYMNGSVNTWLYLDRSCIFAGAYKEFEQMLTRFSIKHWPCTWELSKKKEQNTEAKKEDTTTESRH